LAGFPAQQRAIKKAARRAGCLKLALEMAVKSSHFFFGFLAAFFAGFFAMYHLVVEIELLRPSNFPGRIVRSGWEIR
jgi:hypothetical protein